MTEQEPEARICDNCRHVAVMDGGTWRHPDRVIEKFVGSVCAAPVPGRPAKPGEVKFGRGRDVSRESYSHHATLEDFLTEPGAPVVLATDGSYKKADGHIRNRPICWGYVADSGHYGLGGSSMPPRIVGQQVLQTELRAIWRALRRLIPEHPVLILTDSLDALELIELWRDGSEQMPPGYTLDRASERTATVLQLARLVAANADRVSVQKVQAHTGHPLNEGADALAKIARLWATGRIPMQTAHSDARTIAHSTVTRHIAYPRE
ncbi:RNase H family protein [Micromonospora palomenae]|uniref:RNase H family protein n=1 Tax=Micromonospora palomenae TaxID=1461247 RepID=UPI003F89B30F